MEAAVDGVPLLEISTPGSLETRLLTDELMCSGTDVFLLIQCTEPQMDDECYGCEGQCA